MMPHPPTAPHALSPALAPAEQGNGARTAKRPTDEWPSQFHWAIVQALYQRPDNDPRLAVAPSRMKDERQVESRSADRSPPAGERSPTAAEGLMGGARPVGDSPTTGRSAPAGSPDSKTSPTSPVVGSDAARAVHSEAGNESQASAAGIPGEGVQGVDLLIFAPEAESADLLPSAEAAPDPTGAGTGQSATGRLPGTRGTNVEEPISPEIYDLPRLDAGETGAATEATADAETSKPAVRSAEVMRSVGASGMLELTSGGSGESSLSGDRTSHDDGQSAVAPPPAPPSSREAPQWAAEVAARAVTESPYTAQGTLGARTGPLGQPSADGTLRWSVAHAAAEKGTWLPVEKSRDGGYQLQFDSPELGRILVHVKEVALGLRARLTASSPITQDLLAGQMDQLHAELQRSGVQLAEFSLGGQAKHSFHRPANTDGQLLEAAEDTASPPPARWVPGFQVAGRVNLLA